MSAIDLRTIGNVLPRRSAFLFHWTGKDIAIDHAALEPRLREQYVERVRSILHEGLRLTACHEVVRLDTAFNGYSPRVACFTETRLSLVHEHSRRYGLLGLGFQRNFVLNHGGGPVHYVRGYHQDPMFESITTLTAWTWSVLNDATDETKRAELLSKFQCAYHILAFTKPMTGARSQVEDFELLHENEWRIVETPAMRSNLREVAVPRSGTSGAEDRAVRAISIGSDDLRFLVFPDDETRRLALEDPQVSGFAKKASTPIAFLTLDEAAQL